MSNILVIAPHPDDETLGCGGTLLNHVNSGDKLYWLIMTSMQKKLGFTKEQIDLREKEIQNISKQYNFENFKIAPFDATGLDQIPFSEIVSFISNYISKIKPDIMYIPFQGDVHTDHKVVYKASISCAKTFKHPTIEKVRVYETLSETDHNIDHSKETFSPNLWVDISNTIKKKIEIMKIYKSEIHDFPHPRSEKNIIALANLRGSVCGCQYAESFITIKEIIK